MKSPRRRIVPLFIPHLGCPQQCVFCDQHEITGCRESLRPEAVAQALSALPDGAGMELAFYGGSFTALPAEYQEELLRAALPARERGAVAFLRLSTRPDAIDEAVIARLRRYGVGTVELGAQSMDDDVLRLCRRGHSAGDTRRAARMVKDAGFALILQMMTGLPGSSEASDLATARELIALAPDGVRIYPTVILRGTALQRLWRAGAYREHTVEDAVALCARIVPLFEAAGIPVIRLGLNPTRELSGGLAVGGAYHPALGELVQSRILRAKAEALLSDIPSGSAVTLGVSKGRISAMTGQHRCNIEYLINTFRLSSVKIAEAKAAGEGVVLLSLRKDKEGLEMESKVFAYIEQEERRQRENIELIASENFASENVLRAMGSCLTNKYCEGYPVNRTDGVGKKGRYYGGCQVIDDLEEYCCQKWREVYHTDYHVNVQPHSGSQANQAAYFSVLKPGDTVLAMDLQNGGHLTHGSSVNFSGRIYDFHFYGVDAQGFIDYEDLEEKARGLRPKLILAGASAYSRIIDFERIAAVAREVGAYFMVDIAHIAGLIAAGEHPSPFGLADIITSTTHKTLRGPRGGMIFCKPELAAKVDGGVFPGTQGGPLEHVIAAKAIAAEEALTPEYRAYAHAIIVNTAAMCKEFQRLGYDIVTGGTDNHLFLIDLSRSHPTLTGKDVQEWLDQYHITVNKNCVPGERRSPSQTSGIRIGTAAETTRGRTAEDFVAIAQRIDALIRRLQENISQR